jgi:hypothetical protein
MFSERLEDSDEIINLPFHVKSPTTKKEYTGEVIYEENEDPAEYENTDVILEQSATKQNSKLGVRFSIDEISIIDSNNKNSDFEDKHK